MKETLCLLLVISVFMSGCGGREANPVQIYRPGDETRGCVSLKMEMAQLESDMQRILPKTDKSGTNLLCGAAGVFLIVPWFFMDFKGADKIEFDAMRNRFNYLLTIAAEKECPIAEIEAIPSDEELKKRIAEEKKADKDAAKG